MAYVGSFSDMPMWTSMQEFSQAFVSSIGDWSPSETLRVGQDPGGSRVLEALVNAAAASKAKKKLLRKLKGMWAILAVEPGGNHVVESCFIWGVRLPSVPSPPSLSCPPRHPHQSLPSRQNLSKISVWASLEHACGVTRPYMALT